MKDHKKDFRHETKKDKEKKILIAQRDFVIFQNDYERVIVKDEDISDIPERFHQNLKTEKIIK